MNSADSTQGNFSKDKRTMIRQVLTHTTNAISLLLTFSCRLSGLIHVLYKAMTICLAPTLTHEGDVSPTSDGSVSPPPPQFGADVPSEDITGREAEMSVALTEYFQETRKVYEQVSTFHSTPCTHLPNITLACHITHPISPGCTKALLQ